MISHHLADIMTGETLESTFVIIYRRHQNASLDRQRWRAPRRISTRRCVATTKTKKSRQTENTDAMAESHSLRVHWVGLEVAIGFMVMSSSCHAKKDRWPPPECTNVPADWCRVAWTVLGRSGAEWREALMQDGTVGGRASRGEEGYQVVDSYDAFRMDFSCQDKLATVFFLLGLVFLVQKLALFSTVTKALILKWIWQVH